LSKIHLCPCEKDCHNWKIRWNCKWVFGFVERAGEKWQVVYCSGASTG